MPAPALAEVGGLEVQYSYKNEDVHIAAVQHVCHMVTAISVPNEPAFLKSKHFKADSAVALLSMSALQAYSYNADESFKVLIQQVYGTAHTRLGIEHGMEFPRSNSSFSISKVLVRNKQEWPEAE